MDAPLGLSTGAADIFANTGGVMEAALRTAYEIVTGRELPSANLHVAADRRAARREGGLAEDRGRRARSGSSSRASRSTWPWPTDWAMPSG